MQAPQVGAPTRHSFNAAPSVYLLLFKDDHVLLSLRTNTGYVDGYYGLVAGHVEVKETLREATVREVKEEIGLTLEEHDIDVALVMHRYSAISTPPERLDFFMRINKWQGEPINMEPEKCSDLRWFELSQLPNNVVPYMEYALNEVVAGERYCEYGWADR
jgi:8-oxo-dGTP pyrophosphatase MutT (NUDIX family)